MKYDALITDLIVYFSRNPDEVLTMDDMAVKFGRRTNMHGSLKPWVGNGMLSKYPGVPDGTVGGPMVLFGAGPVLLEKIGVAGGSDWIGEAL